MDEEKSPKAIKGSRTRLEAIIYNIRIVTVIFAIFVGVIVVLTNTLGIVSLEVISRLLGGFGSLIGIILTATIIKVLGSAEFKPGFSLGYTEKLVALC